MDVQDRIAEQSKGVYGNQFGADTWAQFMSAQNPVMQNLMNGYVEQSKTLFSQMQDKMQDQSLNIFSTFPFAPGAKGKEDTSK